MGAVRERGASFDTGAGRRRPGAGGPSVASQIRRPAAPVEAAVAPQCAARRAPDPPRAEPVHVAARGPAPPWAEPVLDEGQPRTRSPAAAPVAGRAPRLGGSGARRTAEPGLHPGAAGPAARHADARPPRQEPAAARRGFQQRHRLRQFAAAGRGDRAARQRRAARPHRAVAHRAPRRARPRARPRATPGPVRRPARPGSGCRWRPGPPRPAWSINMRPFRRRAPALLGGRAAYSAQLNATNRLLVGPFPSESAARAFVGQLSRSGVSGLYLDKRGGPGDRRAARRQ